MSYQRDRDSATRGAGAIASRDMAHPQVTRARQRARAVATLRRDRALRGATMGTGGGVIGGLGAISRAGIAGGLKNPNANRMYGGGQGVEGGSGITTPPVPPRGGGGGSAPTNPLKNRATHAAQLATLVNRGKVPTGGGKPGTTPTRPVKPGRGGKPMYPGTDRPPPAPTPTPAPVDTSTSSTATPMPAPTSSGGGGGGGGVSTSPGSGTTGLDYTPVDLPDVDDDTSSTAAPATSSSKMLLIAAGIGLAALLLLSDDKDTD